MFPARETLYLCKPKFALSKKICEYGFTDKSGLLEIIKLGVSLPIKAGLSTLKYVACKASLIL
jgi:hypothetical protein